MNVAKNDGVPSIKVPGASKKAPRFAHTDAKQRGLGDFYGRAQKNPIGKMREGMGMIPVSKKKLGTPPKKLA
jgi:hypothetical protein